VQPPVSRPTTTTAATSTLAAALERRIRRMYGWSLTVRRERNGRMGSATRPGLRV
jgi:hypothetical protein